MQNSKNKKKSLNLNGAVGFDHTELMSVVDDDFRTSPNELEEYSRVIDPESNTEITGDPSYTIRLCLTLDDDSTTDCLHYFILEHEVRIPFVITGSLCSKDDPGIELGFGETGGTQLVFFRELRPIAKQVKRNPVQLQLTGFANGNIQVLTGHSGLSNGICKEEVAVNPNRYRIKGKILSEPRKHFYSDEAFYCFELEVSNQGNVLEIPIVISHARAKACGIEPNNCFKVGVKIECCIALQGRY